MKIPVTAFGLLALLSLAGSACSPNRDLTTDTPTWPVTGPYPNGQPVHEVPLLGDSNTLN